MTAINVLYELAEEFMDIIIDEYVQYADNPDVKALPKEVDRFITKHKDVYKHKEVAITKPIKLG